MDDRLFDVLSQDLSVLNLPEEIETDLFELGDCVTVLDVSELIQDDRADWMEEISRKVIIKALKNIGVTISEE